MSASYVSRFVLLAVLLLGEGCAHTQPEASRSSRDDLSRPPVPPASLNSEALRAAAPRRMVEAGVGGRAVLRITLDADGTVIAVTVLEESPAGFGFGEACVQVIRAHATGWQPARDASGRAGRYSFRMPFTLEIQP